MRYVKFSAIERHSGFPIAVAGRGRNYRIFRIFSCASGFGFIILYAQIRALAFYDRSVGITGS